MKEDRLVAVPGETVEGWLKHTGQAALLSREQESLLVRRIEHPCSPREADEAKNTLILANLRLVASVARRYLGHGIPLEDLVQEGTLGLIRAIERFDYRRGYRFGTYAIWCIRRAICRAIAAQARVIRLPVHVTDALGRINKTRGRLHENLGRMPTPAELADALNMTEERLSELLHSAVSALSLETPIGEEGENRLADRISDTDTCDPMGEVARNTVRAALMRALDHLTPREKDVIWLRYGLDGDEARTHEEVGRVLAVSRERVRQLEEAALRKLRKEDCMIELRDLVSQ